MYFYSLSTSLLSSHKADAVSRWIMQLCIFGSKVCQLLFVHKSASKLLSQDHGKDQYRWMLKGASQSGGQWCPCTALCDYRSHGLGTDSFWGLSSYLGCWKGRIKTKEIIIKNNPNGDFTVSGCGKWYLTISTVPNTSKLIYLHFSMYF